MTKTCSDYLVTPARMSEDCSQNFCSDMAGRDSLHHVLDDLVVSLDGMLLGSVHGSLGLSEHVVGVFTGLSVVLLDFLGVLVRFVGLVHVFTGVGVVLPGSLESLPGFELNVSPVSVHLASVGPVFVSGSESLFHVSEVFLGVSVSLVGTLGVFDVGSKRPHGLVAVVSSSLEGFPGLRSLSSGDFGVNMSDVVGLDGVIVSRDSGSELFSEHSHELVSVSGVVSGLEVLHSLMGSVGSESSVLFNELSSGGVSGFEGTLRVKEREVSEVSVLGAGSDGEGGNGEDFGEHYYCLIDYSLPKNFQTFKIKPIICISLL